MSKCIAIVGGGFSGTVLAANLLRQAASPKPLTIILIDRGPVLGPGLAYAARDWPYLLNVPAGRLSADSREPLQFLQFARETLPGADPEDFLPRSLYGEYLQRVLMRAERDALPHTKLVRVRGEVVGISRNHGGGFALSLQDAPSVLADQVVLAVGNAPPASLSWEREVAGHPAYRRDPWNLPRALGIGRTVLIVGSGLTMADVALSLAGDAERPPRVISISRRGLLPQPQSAFRPVENGIASASLLKAKSVRELLRAGRELVSISIIAVKYFNNLCQHRCCAPRAAAAKSPERRSTIDAGMQVDSVPADRPAIPGRRALNH